MSNIEKLMNAVPDNSDCAVIVSDINRRYFTGMKSSAGVLLCFRDKAYLIIDFRYIEKARECVKDCEVILQGSLYGQIEELLHRHNAHIISVEAEEMTLSRLNSFRKALKNISFDTTDRLSRKIYDMRSVKSDEDIEKMKTAQKFTDDAFTHILGFIQEGRTEKEIALELDYFMLRNGAEALSFDTIALAGKNTSMPHGVPSDYKVKNGDFVLMDFGAVYDGYHSDMTRTVCVGNPDEKMKDIYNIVLSAQSAALKSVCAGITGRNLDAFAREIIEDAGYGEAFGHSLGHGVGMEIHEYPNASTKSDTILPENAVVTIEPGIYLPQEFCVRIEDMVKITNEGCMNFTHSPKNLICL